MAELALVSSCTVVSNVEKHATHFLWIVAINTICWVLDSSISYVQCIRRSLKYCNIKVEGRHEEIRNLSGDIDPS